MPTTTSPPPKSKVQLEAENLPCQAAQATRPLPPDHRHPQPLHPTASHHPGPPPLDSGPPEPLHQTVSNNSNAFAAQLGGWRQLGSALGLSLTFGGFAYALAHSPRQWDASIYTACGGLLIGFAIPLRNLRP